jgi:hypothetical protein
VLVPGRTRNQCCKKWHNALNPNVDRTAGRARTWTTDEDSNLKGAVQTHGGKNWAAIAALVPGRTNSQCRDRWHNALNPSIDRTPGRTGKWTEDEDIKLNDAVQMHGGKNWAAITALVQGRTKNQCYFRWHYTLDPSIDRAPGRMGKWTEDEDIKLKGAIQTHGEKDWVLIAALVPGRTKDQCHDRWRKALNPGIIRTVGRARTCMDSR